MDYTKFKEEIDHDVAGAMLTLFHEVQSEEGANAWTIMKEFVDKHNKVVYDQFSIEAFIFGDDDFIAYGIPQKLIAYIKDNKLDINVSSLEECLACRKKAYEIDERISELFYRYERGDEDAIKETNLLCDEANMLWESTIQYLDTEVQHVKQQIKLSQL